MFSAVIIRIMVVVVVVVLNPVCLCIIISFNGFDAALMFFFPFIFLMSL